LQQLTIKKQVKEKINKQKEEADKKVALTKHKQLII